MVNEYHDVVGLTTDDGGTEAAFEVTDPLTPVSSRAPKKRKLDNSRATSFDSKNVLYETTEIVTSEFYDLDESIVDNLEIVKEEKVKRAMSSLRSGNSKTT